MNTTLYFGQLSLIVARVKKKKKKKWSEAVKRELKAEKAKAGLMNMTLHFGQ